MVYRIPVRQTSYLESNFEYNFHLLVSIYAVTAVSYALDKLSG